MKNLVATLSLLTISVGLAVTPSLAAQVPAGTKLSPQQELTVNYGQMPLTLDPTLSSTVTEFQAEQPLFDALTREGPDGKFVPAAAASWTVSPDGLTWTFKLRPNATWQDGKPVTASDFVYSFRRLNDPKTGALNGNYLAIAHITNAEEIYQGKKPVTDLGVTAADDQTLVIHLSQPTPWLPQILSVGLAYPLRQDLIEKYGQAWTKPENFVGNGPFKLSQFALNEQMTYQKWDGWWDATHVPLTKVTALFLKDPQTSYFKYLNHETLLAGIPPSEITSVKQQRPDEVKEGSSYSISFIGINQKNVPDAQVRRALKLLINNKLITSKILKQGTATSEYVPRVVVEAQGQTEAPYFNRSYATNRAEAISILQAKGYTADKPLQIHYLTYQSPAMNKVYIAIKDWYEKGTKGLIKLNAEILEPKAYYSQTKTLNFDLVLRGLAPLYNQASTFYNVLTCGHPLNRSNFCSKEFDGLIEQAAETPDAPTREKIYGQATKYLQDDTTIIPLFFGSTFTLVSPALGGFNPNNERHYFRDYYIIANKQSKPAN